jgi:hypothetical protein
MRPRKKGTGTPEKYPLRGTGHAGTKGSVIRHTAVPIIPWRKKKASDKGNNCAKTKHGRPACAWSNPVLRKPRLIAYLFLTRTSLMAIRVAHG